ncbi:hypothetical protein [Pseudomonas sp. RIT-PI-AD]|uniref:hypothetical protein n=1 Tax=Pseudomonas sp. RIT-PI-AD TaxID=3035294 RepID=UPI0021D8979A|nr:hypothetical protein [Pseudomonas sp. RIT-PI-AD]
MQCPECGHTPLAGTQPDPNRCPECGIYYMVAAKLRKEREQGAQQQVRENALPAVSKQVRAATAGYAGAQPVVIVDVNVSFNSLVVLLVKLVVAAIPAIILAAVLFAVFFGAILKYFK